MRSSTSHGTTPLHYLPALLQYCSPQHTNALLAACFKSHSQRQGHCQYHRSAARTGLRTHGHCWLVQKRGRIKEMNNPLEAWQRRLLHHRVHTMYHLIRTEQPNPAAKFRMWAWSAHVTCNTHTANGRLQLSPTNCCLCHMHASIDATAAIACVSSP